VIPLQSMSNIKRICICAVCIALCYVLPLAFHAIGGGSVFLPMHIPVLLCGLISGPVYGVFCGLIGPILSNLLSGMPAPTQLISMIPELCTYGLVSGLLLKFIRTGRVYADLYLAMVPAMFCGRVVAGLAKALLYLSSAEGYSLSIWVSAHLVESLPGTILQLLVIPTLVFTLMKARLIPERYPN